MARNQIFALWKKRQQKNLFETFLSHDSHNASASLASAGHHPNNTYGKPYEALSKKEDAAFLEAAINRLPPPDRELIIMRYMSHLGHAEIASITQQSLTNVKVRLHRIREKLESDYKERSHA